MATNHLREGDVWEYEGNFNVYTERHITLIGNERIAYRDAHGREHVCLLSTFRRWVKGADLVSRIPEDGQSFIHVSNARTHLPPEQPKAAEGTLKAVALRAVRCSEMLGESINGPTPDT